jgi:hypothetical protein
LNLANHPFTPQKPHQPSIGLTYYKTGKKQQGLVYLQSAKKIAQEIDDCELNQASHPQKKKLNLANHPFTPQKPHQPSNQTT